MELVSKLKVTLIVFATAILTLVWYLYDQHKTIVLKETQILALTDTVKLYRNKTGASGAEKRVFVGTHADVLLAAKTSDPKAIAILKNTKDVHSYTDFTTVAKIDTSVKAKVSIAKDSLTGKPVVTASADIQEPKGFYDAKVEVKKDLVALQVHLTDQYHITAHVKSNGFFKPKSYVVTVENENPYVSITGLNSFEIKPKNKLKTGIKIGGVGVALGAAAFLLLHK